MYYEEDYLTLRQNEIITSLEVVTAQEQFKNVTKLLNFFEEKDEKFRHDKNVMPTQLQFVRNMSFERKTALDFMIYFVKLMAENDPKVANEKEKVLKFLESTKSLKQVNLKELCEFEGRLEVERTEYKNHKKFISITSYDNLYLLEHILFCLLQGLSYHCIYDVVITFIYKPNISNKHKFKWHDELYENFLKVKAFFSNYKMLLV